MVGTPQTTNFLVNTDFTLTGAAGRINPQMMEDFVVSGPQWDAPGGVPAPNILRGTTAGLQWFLANGGAVGAGQTTLQRQTNFTQLNALFADALAKGKFLELEEGIYEIDSPTTLLMAGGGAGYNLVFRGSMAATIIKQFNAAGSGVPILTIGDVTGITSMNNADIRGLQFQFGTSQLGLTNSAYFAQGYLFGCHIEDIYCFGTTPFIPQDATQITNTGTTGNFSNIGNHWKLFGWQRHGINFNAAGSSGNSFDNIYMNISAAVANNTITGSYLKFTSGTQDWHMKRLNCEHGACNSVIDMSVGGVNGLTVDAMHVENVLPTGADPSVFLLNGGSFLINTLDVIVHAASASLTGTYAMVRDWTGSASSWEIKNLALLINSVSQLNTPVEMASLIGGMVGADFPAGVIGTGYVRDGSGNQFSANIVFDTHLAATANVLVTKWVRYKLGLKGSLIEGAVLNVSGAYTHYGQMEDTIIVLAATGSYTINLAATMGATGTQKPRTGNTVSFLRPTYTSGTVTIQNAGGALTTNASTASVFCQFDGTNWVTFTQVT